MMDELQKQSFDLRGAVRFAGNINRDSLPEYYRKAEIVVVPSVTDASGNRDGLPNVFLEALASGCAVVASDIPGIKNVVQSGKEAVIVPSGDPDSLAGAILDLLGNAERREELRREARKRAVESYSWEVKSRLLESVYQKVL